MCFIHLCRQCCCLCSPPVFLILQHNRLTQGQPLSLQSTHFSCLLGGLHLCGPPLAQPPLLIVLALQTLPDLVCHVVSLLLTLKCQFTSLGEAGLSAILLKRCSQTLCIPLVLSVTFGRSWLGTSANLHMLLCLRKLQQSSLGQRSAETRYWPCSSFLLLPDLLSVVQCLDSSKFR